MGVADGRDALSARRDASRCKPKQRGRHLVELDAPSYGWLASYRLSWASSLDRLGPWELPVLPAAAKLAAETAKKRKRLRGEWSKRVVDAFFDWCEREVHLVLDDTPISKGIHYALNQREALRRFLSDGRLPIHNNNRIGRRAALERLVPRHAEGHHIDARQPLSTRAVTHFEAA